jgi:hypothetical protein
VLQFQFYANGTLERDWTDNAYFVDAPLTTTVYATNVRCSTAKTGDGQAAVTVAVGCPSTGAYTWIGPLHVDKTAGPDGAEPNQDVTISWTDSWTDLIRGDLSLLRTGTYTGSVLACGLSNVKAASATDGTVLAAGGGLYFLARGAYCNVASTPMPVPATYSTGAAREKGSSLTPRTRDAEINADPRDCP